MSEFISEESTLREKFLRLHINIRRAVQLLHNQRSSASIGVGQHGGKSCPIYYTYRITTYSRWESLDPESMAKLSQAGWSKLVYDEFLWWYDAMRYAPSNTFYMRESEKILRWALTQEVLPQTA